MKLLIGGSPCTHWSIAQTKNRETKPEGIGWELFLNYRIARDKFKPDYFLYENNKSMSAAIREQITKELGVEPALINSALVSAQNRQRLYWAGKRNPDGSYSTVPVEQPADRGILLRDILETVVAWREKGYTLKANYSKSSAVSAMNGGHFPAPMAAEPVRIGTIDSGTQTSHDSKPFRVYSPDGKAVTMQGEAGGYGAKTGLYAVPVAGRVVGRRINEAGHRDDCNESLPHIQRFEVNDDPQKTNCLTTVQKDNMVALPVRVGTMPNKNGEPGTSQSRRIYSADGKSVPLQARPNGGGADGASTGLYAVPCDCDVVLTDTAIRCQRRDKKHSTVQGSHVNFPHGKSQTVSVAHTPRGLERGSTKGSTVYEVQDSQITINGKRYPIKLRDGSYIIRKLTVNECKRLQTVPDDYIFPVSDTQAYKMLGNGWTVDVIAHILSHIPGITTEPLTVLSMYDGMSCGHIALDKLGSNVERYYATEIDKWAIKTTQANYPDTVQLGDAFGVRAAEWGM